MLLGTGVQVHASFLKHDLGTGTIKGRALRGRGPKESQREQTQEELFTRRRGPEASLL